VASNAPASVTNTASVSGGGEQNTANNTANDLTTINPILYSLSVNFTGSGTGSVYNTANLLTCGTTCSYQINAGTGVTLRATADQYSLFGGWSGVCVNTAGDCSFTMGGTKSATAAFSIDTAHSVMIGVPSPLYYPTIQSAYQAAVDNAIIQIWGIDFSEGLIFDQGRAVTVQGGYNGGYSNNSGVTTVHGTVSLVNGTVTIDNLNIM